MHYNRLRTSCRRIKTVVKKVKKKKKRNETTTRAKNFGSLNCKFIWKYPAASAVIRYSRVKTVVTYTMSFIRSSPSLRSTDGNTAVTSNIIVIIIICIVVERENRKKFFLVRGGSIFRCSKPPQLRVFETFKKVTKNKKTKKTK